MASRMGRSGDLLPGTAAVCESEVWRNVDGALSGREKTPAPFVWLGPSCGLHLSTVRLPRQWSSFRGGRSTPHPISIYRQLSELMLVSVRCAQFLYKPSD